MNKTQLIVMWVGIALFLLFLISPPKKTRRYVSLTGQGSKYTRVNKELQRTLLIVIPLVSGGLIVTFRDKKKSDKVWQLLTNFWQKLTKYALWKNIDKEPKAEEKQ